MRVPDPDTTPSPDPSTSDSDEKKEEAPKSGATTTSATTTSLPDTDDNYLADTDNDYIYGDSLWYARRRAAAQQHPAAPQPPPIPTTHNVPTNAVVWDRFGRDHSWNIGQCATCLHNTRVWSDGANPPAFFCYECWHWWWGNIHINSEDDDIYVG